MRFHIMKMQPLSSSSPFFSLLFLLSLLTVRGEIIWSFGDLSQPRTYLSSTAVSGLVIFAGGHATNVTDRVDIYNTSSGSWTSTSLSIPRSWLAATSVGALAMFAGGQTSSLSPSSKVDVYDSVLNRWDSKFWLSSSRYALAATSVEQELALFAGGIGEKGNVSHVVDIFELSCDCWRVATLSQARAYLVATSVGKFSIFAGGISDQHGTLSSAVDIFDSHNNKWSTSSLSIPRLYLAAGSVADLALFAGGCLDSFCAYSTSIVDMYNVSSSTWSQSSLSVARGSLAAACTTTVCLFAGGSGSFGSSDIVDVYDIEVEAWSSLSLLSQNRSFLIGVSLGDIVLFGGGEYDGTPVPTVDIGNCSSFPYTITSTTSAITASSTSTSSPTATTSSFSTTSSPDRGTSSGSQSFVTILVISIVVAVCCVIVVISAVRRWRKKDNRRDSLLSVVNPTTSLDVRNNEDYDEKEDAKYMPVPTVEMVLGFEEGERQGKSETYTEFDTDYHSFTPGRELISFDGITLGRKIGEGQSGCVYIAKWRGINVAVKDIGSRMNEREREEFFIEAEIMIKLRPHSNVVQFFGVASTSSMPLCLVTEYCDGGSLHSLIHSDRKIKREHWEKIVRGIAAGMMHLHQENVVHRDLAARNILLAAEYTPKVADLGRSRIAHASGEGTVASNIGPLKHMAPESLTQRKYSFKSDVWSFGVTLYEIFERSEPYVGVNAVEAATLVVHKTSPLRLSVPAKMSVDLAEIYLSCFSSDPTSRPSFDSLCERLGEINMWRDTGVREC